MCTLFSMNIFMTQWAIYIIVNNKTEFIGFILDIREPTAEEVVKKAKEAGYNSYSDYFIVPVDTEE